MNEILVGDALTRLKGLPGESVQCCVTSPPYWGLRDYGVNGQLGLEKTPEEYVSHMVEVFREVRRVLRKDGTLWIVLGDSYSAKRLVGIPWRIALALQVDGWYLRSDIIWNKPNPMPESVTDRPTKAHEYIFLMTKCVKYHYNADAIREPHSSSGKVVDWRDRVHDQSRLPKGMRQNGQKGTPSGVAGFHPKGRNRRTVWKIPTTPFPEAHFAVFPEKLVETCILAGCPEGGVVLDPFMGSGTTGLVALKIGRGFIGIELNPGYVKLAEQRIRNKGNNGRSC